MTEMTKLRWRKGASGGTLRGLPFVAHYNVMHVSVPTLRHTNSTVLCSPRLLRLPRKICLGARTRSCTDEEQALFDTRAKLPHLVRKAVPFQRYQISLSDFGGPEAALLRLRGAVQMLCPVARVAPTFAKPCHPTTPGHHVCALTVRARCCHRAGAATGV
jgi:hypothetical protein